MSDKYQFEVPEKIRKVKPKRNYTFLGYCFVFFAAVLLAAFSAFKLYLLSLPPIHNLEDFKPNIITKIISSDGEIIKTFTAYTFKKVELEEIPDTLIQAIIATEDKNFYHHAGYDLVGLARSIVANVMAGRVVQGASTITQQLSRILFLNNEKTFNRKIKEFVIAARIEKSISKDQILEMYLNNVYLGSGSYGVEGAAQIYFNKSVKQLTLPEMALIAGLPQAPRVYSPFNNPKKAEKRRNQVLKRMYKMRFITKDEYLKARKEPIKLNHRPNVYTYNKAPYFCDYVMRELDKLGFDEEDISQGGYKITTTLDYNTQLATNDAIVNDMNAYGLKGDNNQAAVFAYNHVTGKIIAYAGGRDYSKSQYDRITQAIRPPGSAFKPFVYAAALEKGITPNDMVEDMPVKIGNWAPRNYGNKYRGNIPVYTALMVSSNVCAARMIEYTGIRPVIQMARMLGLTTPIEYDYTIALGSNGVKLFEFTRAYGAFANGGFKVEPYAVERIEDSKGKVLYEAPSVKPVKVMNLSTASEMTAILKTVITNGTGMAANIGKPAAGKTGTTDDSKDGYFMGYTPNIVAGVWVGNDDNTKVGNLTGGTVPATIWKDVMKVATQSYGNVDFQYASYDLTPFKAGKSVRIITPEAVQKAFDKKEKELKEKEEKEKTSGTEYVDETPVETSIPKILPTKKKEVKKPESAPTPQPETSNTSTQIIEEANKLAPIPMASPF